MRMSKHEECPDCGAGAVAGHSAFDYDGQTCQDCGWPRMRAQNCTRPLNPAERDAQRYRWLVENAFVGVHKSAFGKRLTLMDADRELPWRDDFYDDDVDAAIDAAIDAETADHQARQDVDALIDAVIAHEIGNRIARRTKQNDADS